MNKFLELFQTREMSLSQIEDVRQQLEKVSGERAGDRYYYLAHNSFAYQVPGKMADLRQGLETKIDFLVMVMVVMGAILALVVVYNIAMGLRSVLSVSPRLLSFLVFYCLDGCLYFLSGWLSILDFFSGRLPIFLVWMVVYTFSGWVCIYFLSGWMSISCLVDCPYFQDGCLYFLSG